MYPQRRESRPQHSSVSCSVSPSFRRFGGPVVSARLQLQPIQLRQERIRKQTVNLPRRSCHDLDSDLFRIGCSISRRYGRLALHRGRMTDAQVLNCSLKFKKRLGVVLRLVQWHSVLGTRLIKSSRNAFGKSIPVRRQVVPLRRMVTRKRLSGAASGETGSSRF